MPISTHDQYYIWGIRDLKQGSNMIIVGYDARALKFIKTLFKSVQQVDYTYNKYTMPYNNRPIYLGRYFIKDAKQVWKQKPNMTM